eukprot:TCONS_00062875-protein
MASKSMPATEFEVYVSSADSGIDSDSASIAKLNSSLESIEQRNEIDPTTLLADKNAPHNERVEGIGKALDWLRDELTKMKETDKKLTKRFIKMRSRIADHKEFIENGGLLAVEQPILLETTTDDCTSELMRRKMSQKRPDYNLIAKDGAFPTHGLNFENNKRATWVI